MSKLTLQYEGIVLKEYAVGCGRHHRASSGQCGDHRQPGGVRPSRARVSRGDRVILEDLRSTNGTFVNGRPVTRHVLQHGDEVLVGKHSARVRSERGRVAAGSAPMPEPRRHRVSRHQAASRAARDARIRARRCRQAGQRASSRRSAISTPTSRRPSRDRRKRRAGRVQSRRPDVDHRAVEHRARPSSRLVQAVGGGRDRRSGNGYVVTAMGGKPLINEERARGPAHPAGRRHAQCQRPGSGILPGRKASRAESALSSRQ